jgi:hypothetical protein
MRGFHFDNPSFTWVLSTGDKQKPLLNQRIRRIETYYTDFPQTTP